MGKLFHFTKKSRCSPPWIFLIVIIVAPFIFSLLEKNDFKKKASLRNNQLIHDYPELISKLSLLTTAGMSISNAIFRIVGNYQKYISAGGQKRYVYEELSVTCQQLKNGLYESYAYEDMGHRYGLPCYIKLSSILISGLKHGSSDFNRLLSAEATTALLEQKASVLQKSGKASTKLLGPMMMIFAVILMLIMIPAFFSMGL